MTLEDCVDDLPDIVKLAEQLVEDLQCAETCESVGDLRANIDEALTNLKRMTADLVSLKLKCNRVK